MELFQATLKLFVETLHLAVAKLVDFLEQLANRLLNLVLQAVELLQRIVHQAFDLGRSLFELLVDLFHDFINVLFGFLRHGMSPYGQVSTKINIRPSAGNRTWSLGNDVI